MSSDKITKGSCFCRSIQYTYTDTPPTTALCHCSVCKQLSGSLFALHYPIHPDKFSITAGEPKLQCVPSLLPFLFLVPVAGVSE